MANLSNALTLPLVALALLGTVHRAWTADTYITDERQDDKNKKLLPQLITLNRAFVDAAIKGDRTKLEALVAPEYSAFEPYYPYLLTGRDTLLEIQQAWADYAKTPAGSTLITRQEAQPRVQLLGRKKNIAILTYVEFEAMRTPMHRVTGGRTGKASFIYHWVGNQWLLVYSHIATQAGRDYSQVVR